MEKQTKNTKGEGDYAASREYQKNTKAWAESGKPLTALVPEHDDYLQPAEARERFSVVPQAEVVGVDGCKHLWVGETYVRRALDEIVARVRPGFGPLPTTWDGEVVED